MRRVRDELGQQRDSEDSGFGQATTKSCSHPIANAWRNAMSADTVFFRPVLQDAEKK